VQHKFQRNRLQLVLILISIESALIQVLPILPHISDNMLSGLAVGASVNPAMIIASHDLISDFSSGWRKMIGFC